MAWSMNNLSRILEGDTRLAPELLGFLSLLTEVGETWLLAWMLATLPSTFLLGEILLAPVSWSFTPKFSRSIFIRSRN